jgi:hypothetical protein
MASTAGKAARGNSPDLGSIPSASTTTTHAVSRKDAIMTASCFTCKTEPAGNDYGGSCSAYCAGCQPQDTRPQLRGSQCRCAACGRLFATLTDFDRHQERPEGVFAGRCLDPAPLGLAPAGGVWGTPEGNAKRALLASQMAAVRSRSTRESRANAAVPV